MNKIQNPILKGFNPDPSFLYVDGVYYIATSTFEWSPGVQIHYSKNLVNWKSVGILKDKKHLDLTGIPSSGGVWSDSVKINSSGYDPFVFHDENGKSYVTCHIWDYRKKETYWRN